MCVCMFCRVKESQVTLECIIPSQHHRAVAGPKWCHVNELTQRYNVSINFPDRQTTQQQQTQQPAQHEGLYHGSCPVQAPGL